MTENFERLHRFGLKIFFDPIREIETGIFIPVFHRWIQEKAVETLLIDVADYRHVKDGPSILLAGYEANYAIDVSEGRPSLCYYRKQPCSGSLSTKLTLATRALLKAASLLETDVEVGATCKFRYDEICFFPNDRLVAPTTAYTSQNLVTELEGFRHLLFREKNISIDHSKRFDTAVNIKERIFFSIKGESGATAKELINNLS
tara:strand:- start:932 stop:1540 length:609 start_codon:yes stop_codon:yes gene_type:complete